MDDLTQPASHKEDSCAVGWHSGEARRLEIRKTSLSSRTMIGSCPFMIAGVSSPRIPRATPAGLDASARVLRASKARAKPWKLERSVLRSELELFDPDEAAVTHDACNYTSKRYGPREEEKRRPKLATSSAVLLCEELLPHNE